MAKATINPPTRHIDDPLYLADCRLALEPSLTKLADLAIEAGWPPKTVGYSLLVLSAQLLKEYSRDDPQPPEARPREAGTIPPI